MSFKSETVDRIAVWLTLQVIRFRWVVLIVAVIVAALIGSGASNLEFSSNYRTFFSKENPELTAFENLQATYTKNDNILFVVVPRDGAAFSNNTLAAIEELTTAAWQIPFVIRVDSVTNFQHTHAEDDDIIVEDLVVGADGLTPQELADRKAVALTEPLLLNQLVTSPADVTAVNVVLQYPQLDVTEVPEAAGAAREIRKNIEEQFDGVSVYLSGVSMLNNAFAETGQNDAANLMPLMFLAIFVMTWLIVRSLTATFSTLVVIALSTVVAMGIAGFAGVKLTPISMSATIVILTLAVADSIHILISLRGLMREGMPKLEALPEAIRLNFIAVGITSLTTIVGFLALNFSDAPPFWHLGNITAVGIAAAWLFSMTVLPALIAILPMKVKRSDTPEWSQRAMTRLANFVISNRRKLLVGIGSLSILLIAFIPTIDFNDQWVEYFDTTIEFRNHSDQIRPYFGLYPIEFSVPAKGPGGVSDPEYLKHLEAFAEYLRTRPEVTHVYSISDIMKRLNRNMHGDNPDFYRIPDNRELSAQYLLLYELSLPYGLDMNDRINIDKSASRLTATLGSVTTVQTKAMLRGSRDWMADNFPDYMQAQPTSAQVMFTYITDRNVRSMILGTTGAIIAIAVIMILALQSVKLGLLSMVPNALPILTTFGAWAILVGEVGFSVATVASISLGIIVDDTVHFMTKYVRAHNEQGLSTEDSIRYAFQNVGLAIVVNTIILIVGFWVLTTSAFKMNADMGLLTMLAIAFALILDFLLLPALLLSGSKTEGGQANSTGVPGAASV